MSYGSFGSLRGFLGKVEKVVRLMTNLKSGMPGQEHQVHGYVTSSN